MATERGEKMATDRLRDIELRIAALQKFIDAEEAREKRVMDKIVEVYGKQEETRSPFAYIMKMMKPSEVKEYIKIQEEEAQRLIEVATPQLQLTSEEITHIERRTRALLHINPCFLTGSPVMKCSFNAFTCNSNTLKYGKASASCVCNIQNNELNPKVQANGYATTGWSYARVKSWCWFEVPAHPNPALARVDIPMEVHGLYILRSSQYSPWLKLELEAKGYQYGWEMGNTGKKTILNLNGDKLGRHDANEFLQFYMPIGANDTFRVLVRATLTAIARGAGALSVGDFGTGNGNYIKIIYVNTFS